MAYVWRRREREGLESMLDDAWMTYRLRAQGIDLAARCDFTGECTSDAARGRISAACHVFDGGEKNSQAKSRYIIL